MSWTLILGLITAWIILPALVIIAVCRRTLFGDRADDLSNQGADEGAWGVINHDQLNSQREQGNHG